MDKPKWDNETTVHITADDVFEVVELKLGTFPPGSKVTIRPNASSEDAEEETPRAHR